MAKKAKKMEMMVVASKVKAYIKGNGCKTASESLEALNCKVACLLDKACKRTNDNKRTTVKPYDL